ARVVLPAGVGQPGHGGLRLVRLDAACSQLAGELPAGVLATGQQPQRPLDGGGLRTLPPQSRAVAHDAPGPHPPPGQQGPDWSQPATSGPSAPSVPGEGWKRRPSLAAKIIPDSVRSDRVVITLGLGHRQHLFAQLGFQLQGDLGIFLEVGACVFLALADTLAAVAVPGAGLVEELGLHAQLDQLALAADALAVQDLGDDLLERRRHLVLDDLDAGLVADDLVALLDRADTADVQAHRGIELERVAAGSGFRTLARHHDADLVAQLVDEDHHAVAALDVAGQLAQRLAHQSRLQAGKLVAHFALDLGARGERRHRVDHHHVDRVGAHQHVGDFQRLLAGVGLADQQVVDVDRKSVV